MIKRENHIIDATGRTLGELSTEIAVLLRGKNKPEFLPNKDIGDFVVVKNVGKLKFSGKKLEKKIYYHHTEYLGGLKKIKLRDAFEKEPAEVLKKSVFGMLPKNKLRAQQIKRLKTE